MSIDKGSEQTLRSWNLIRPYNKYKKQLIDLAHSVYEITTNLLGGPANQEDVTDIYAKTLLYTSLFNKIVESNPQIPHSFYSALAEELARYTIDQNWSS